MAYTLAVCQLSTKLKMFLTCEKKLGIYSIVQSVIDYVRLKVYR
jgi:hypothetical protein